jgi:uncharacterized protein
VPPLAFLDTNVILRHLLGDNEELSPRATAFIERVDRGEVRVYTSDAVISEVVFTLERSYRQPKPLIRQGLQKLLALPGLVLPGKQRIRRVLDLYVDLNLPYLDAHHVVLMEQLGLAEIVSFDHHFDRVPGIHRTEP